jgi:ATP-dependent helicase HrpB
MKAVQPLPIDPFMPEIVRSVERNPITLLQAEPGAGKTTRVPPALLSAGFSEIYVLEPRRLAARMAARRVAEEMGERLGETVGYQVRFEEVSSRRTRLFYVTEGILTRRLLTDRLLHRARVVVLDEFHERHLEADLALALLRRVQDLRRDLHLLIMSATLSGDELVAKLDNPTLIRAPGRLFPVDVRYTPHSAAPLEEQVAAATAIASRETEGHILIFLPGAAEIRKAIRVCEPLARRIGAHVLLLHGDLTPEQQDAVVSPSATRKIICSTNVAESSITIDGVQAVIDSGLARVMSHSPWSGLARLQIQKISKASAVQRSGRAGRTGPGIGIRLYSEADFVRRAESIPPAITREDLTSLLLQLASMALHWDELRWMDEPAPEMRTHAQDLLLRLGALDTSGDITPLGQRMATLPVHPRLARFLLQAGELGASRAACDVAARISEDRVRTDDQARGNFGGDIEAILAAAPSYRARRLREQLFDALAFSAPSHADPDALEKAFLSAYPDRVARRRGDTLLLSNGASAQLDGESHVHSEFLVAIEVDDRSDRTTPLIRVASPIEADWLLDLFPNRIVTREEVAWNREAERVEQVNSILYDKLVLDESRGEAPDPNAAADLLVEKALADGIERFVDREELDRFLRRVRFASQHSAIVIPNDLLAAAVRRLAEGRSSFAQLRDATKGGGLLAALQSQLPMREIDEVAPAFVTLPGRRRARIEYHDGRPPSVASRLQDFFGMKETPSVARGTVPLVVQLLAPNQRPVQVTTDLVSFWKNLYPQVRRELSRRYPKHAWPEIPI